MPPFTQQEIEQCHDIFRLFQNGGVVLFKRQDLWRDQISQLRDANYLVAEIRCDQHGATESLLIATLQALDIDVPSTGLDGFNDYLRYLDFKAYKGIIVAYQGFHLFRKRDDKGAFAVLDIFAHQHRSHLLFGNRLLAMAQSDDGAIDKQIGEIGGYRPIWNSAEWLNSAR